MRVITITTGKGGTGKSTTAAEIVALLAARGKRVGVLDMDGQGDVGERLGITEDARPVGTAADVLAGRMGAQEAALASPVLPSADVLVGGRDLEELATTLDVRSLAAHLRELASAWDALVIDTAPALAVLTAAAVAAADVVVIPVECRPAAVRKVRQTVALTTADQDVWLLPTEYDARTALSPDAVATMQAQMPGRVAPRIRSGVAAAYAEAAQLPTSLYDPACAVAQDYADALALILPA